MPSFKALAVKINQFFRTSTSSERFGKKKYRNSVNFFYSVQSLTFKTFMKPRNRFQGIISAILCSLEGRYDNPIPTRFLASIDCLKIPAQC